MSSSLPLWLVKVFGSPTSHGNVTGVVLCEQRLEGGRCQRLAADLGCPDTAFVVRGNEPGSWEIASYSPYEALALCTQTLLASESVLGQAGRPFVASIRSGRVEVRREPETGLAWVLFREQGVRLLDASPRVRPLLGPVDLASVERVIDAGRRRVYARLGSATALDQVAISPEAAKAFCLEAGIHGICLLADAGDGSLRLRVFTTSLDGAEDSATGGAVAALPAYFTAAGETRRYPLRVEQGSGPAQRRGTLFVRAAAGGAELSGATQLIAEGSLRV